MLGAGEAYVDELSEGGEGKTEEEKDEKVAGKGHGGGVEGLVVDWRIWRTGAY